MRVSCVIAGAAWFVAASVVGSAVAAAQPHQGNTLTPRLRPHVASVTITSHSESGGNLAVHGRQRLTYNRKGKLALDESWDGSGRLIISVRRRYDGAHRETARVVTQRGKTPITRTVQYTLDAKGHVTEARMNVPSAHIKLRWQYLHSPSGELRIRKYDRRTRHDKNEYYRGSRSYDAKGRLTRRCSGGWCTMLWYDKHGTVAGQRDQNKRTHNHRNFRNTYDSAGRLASAKRDGRTLTFRYNKRGDVTVETTTVRNRVTARRVHVYRYR